MEVLSSPLKVVKQAVGGEDDAVLDIMEDLSDVYTQQGQHDQATLQWQYIVDTSAASNGLRDMSTLRRQRQLGVALMRAGRLVEAESVLHPTLDMLRGVVGDVHWDCLLCMEFLAYVLASQRQFEEAILLYYEAERGYEAIQGSASPGAAGSRGLASEARQKLSSQDEIVSFDQHGLKENGGGSGGGNDAAATPDALTSVEVDGRKSRT